MSIWTRLAEALSNIGDSVGAFLSKLAGSHPRTPEKSIAFTIGMIALGAKMAKADGVVTGEEVRAFKQVFHVPAEELSSVARVFDLAKKDTAGFEFYARQIARLFASKAPVLEDVMDGLFHIAKADDAVHPAELEFLEQVAVIFGFQHQDFERIKSRHVAEAGDPHVILGVPHGASLAVIRAKYRQLVREHHPDRHIAAGVPEEMIELATERLAQINAAYDRIVRQGTK